MIDEDAARMPQQRWVFRGRLVGVVDGATLDVEIDLGARTRRTERLALVDVAAPDVETDAGIYARDHVAAWCGDAGWRAVLRTDGKPSGWPLVIRAARSDGRYVASVWNVDGGSLNISIRDALLALLPS